MVRHPPAGKLYRLVLGLTLAAAMSAAPALAGQEGLACGDEIEKYCGDIKPGQLSITACLDANREHLSPECRAKVDRAMARIAQEKQICEADIGKFCAGVKPGEGRILDCLLANKALLTPECGQIVDKYAVASGSPRPKKTPGQ